MALIMWWWRLRARFERTDEGASLVEYAFLVGLIAMVCILAVTFLGTSVSHRYSQMGSGLG